MPEKPSVPRTPDQLAHDALQRRRQSDQPAYDPSGVDDWCDFTFMHRDYFAANRRVFDSKLLDLCLYNAPDSIAIADPKRGLRAPERLHKRRGHRR